MAKKKDGLDAQELADKLGVTRTTIWKWVEEKKIKCNRLGPGKRARIRFTEAQVEAFVSGKK